MQLLRNSKLTSSTNRVKIVALLTSGCGFIYHLFILFIFYFAGVYPMFHFNFISVTLFFILFFVILTSKSSIIPYMFALAEVITHQILAEYYLGTSSEFHYFILLIGLLPFLIFEDKFKLSIPVTILACLLFVILENLGLKGVYYINPVIFKCIKIINVSIPIFVICLVMLVFTVTVYKVEENLEGQNKMLANEIKMASVIQQSFFKQNIGKVSNWDVAYYSKPMAGVSGDIYDFYKTENHLDGIGIFDVSGHGISSGLVTMLVKNIIYQEFYNHPDFELWEILNTINDRVIEEKGDIENYLTGILVRIKDNRIEFACAGHPNPIIYKKRTGKCEYFKAEKESVGAIGIPGYPVYFTSEFIDFETGDVLVLYSDGVYDNLNENNENFGKSRLLNTIALSVNKTAGEISEELENTLKAFRGNQIQSDDITFIVLKK